jgi:hypothetical protein
MRVRMENRSDAIMLPTDEDSWIKTPYFVWVVLHLPLLESSSVVVETCWILSSSQLSLSSQQ